MVIITNGVLTAKIEEKGAELRSLMCGNKEYIWQGDERYWTGSAPILFPICSGLKDDEYILDGKTYGLNKHGFAKNMVFDVEKNNGDSVTFLLKSDEQTLKVYPFEFELRVTFALNDKKLDVKYDVKNVSEKDMYFSIGAHEAYACPEGIEEYDVELPQKETLYTSVLEGNVLGNKKELILDNGEKIALKYDYFAVDALVFKDIKARSVILNNRKGGRKVKVTFNGFDYLLLWTKPSAGYICIEPWCGISDNIDTDKNFKNKEGINVISKGDTFTRLHSLEIIE